MTAINVLDRVRLDVERDLATGELVNLIQNPSGDLGGWGWITPVASTAMSGGTELAYAGVASVANWFTSELSPVTAGNYVAASWTNPFHTNSGLARAQLVWYDSTGAVVSSGTQGAYQTSAGSYSISATVVPAGVTQVALRFDLYSTTGGVAPTSTTKSMWLTDVTMATASTATALLVKRTNLVKNPSFESDASNWTPSSASLSRVTTQASVGTASCSVTTSPTVATNLVTNPNFETSTSGWTAGGNTLDIAQAVTEGQKRCRLRATTNVSVARANMNYSSTMPVIAGQTYQIGLSFMAPTISGCTYDSLRGGTLYRWYNASSVQIGADGDMGRSISLDTWYNLAGNITAPAGATQLKLFPYIDYSMSAVSGTFNATMYFDYIYATDTPSAGYFDGNLADGPAYQYDWTGTANLSTSTRTTVVATAAAKTPMIPVSPGMTYAASAAFRAASTTRQVQIDFNWLNSSGAALSTTATAPGTDSASQWSRYGSTAVAPAGAANLVVSYGFNTNVFTAGEVHYLDAALVEASTSAGTYFDGATAAGGGFTYAWTGTANASTSTATSTNNLVDLPPAYYVSVTGEAASISIDRNELNLSTLTATIVSTNLDPSASTLLQPKRRCRILVDTTGSGGWEPIFTGRTKQANVEYHLLENDPERRAVITLLAVDPLTRLSQEPRPDGVATIAALPFVLEGCGVPWNVNGSGNQVPTATVVASNDQATAIDQVAVTRDTVSGYAWVDRKGVLQAWDAASISSTVKDTLDEDTYTTDFGISYGTDKVINSVSVEAYEVNPATGETSTAQYGPYRDPALQPGDDIYDKTFTVQGLTEAQIVTLANGILAANKTPTRRIDYVVLPLTQETISRALLDLYDLVEVINTRAGLDDNLRIVGVTHTITAGQGRSKWLMRLDFTGDGVVASPQLIPAPSTGSGSALPATGLQIGKGVSVGSIASGASPTIAVTFPVAYATATNLKVDVIPFNSRLTPGLASLSATGFTVALSNWSTGNMAGTTFDWSAQTL